MTEVYKGSTSHRFYVELVDSSTGLPKTGILYSDVTGSYVRAGAARTAITMVTLASASAAWTSGGFILVDDTNQPGIYRFDIPDVAFATGVEEVIVTVKATGCRTQSRGFTLTDWNKQIVPTGLLAYGTVASTTGTTTTLDTGATATASFYVGSKLVVTGGTGAGQERIITAYSAGRVATHEAWTTNPTSSSTWAIVPARSSPTATDISGAIGTGTGPYPINHSGGLGAGAVAATIDLAGGTTFAAWAADALRYTSDGVAGVSGLGIRAYGKTAYDAVTGSGLAGTTGTNAEGRWAAPLNLASGDYVVIADVIGDGYQSHQTSIRIP